MRGKECKRSHYYLGSYKYSIFVLKVWCATAVTLRGGLDKDGKYITGDPIYFSPSAAKLPKGKESSDELENEITVSSFVLSETCKHMSVQSETLIFSAHVL